MESSKPRRVRLRTAVPDGPGWSRQRVGRGFRYVDQYGRKVSSEDVRRAKDLVIPPAWEHVWICPHHNGHIQAVGTDARGRRQYIYHPQWRTDRDADKHERVLRIAARLPVARRAVADDLAAEGMPWERALATGFRLLDLGYFRIGSDTYTTQNGSYGLTTLERRHVKRIGGRLVFEFTAKSGVAQHIEITDRAVLASVEAMRRRRGAPPTLLAYRDGRRWLGVAADELNEYLRDLLGDEMSAKDFRTWHGTVLAAERLARVEGESANPRRRNRAIAGVMRQVADHLGNTPTVVRNAYVDSRVVDLYSDGVTIARTLPRLDRLGPRDPRRQASLERAVRRLLAAAD